MEVIRKDVITMEDIRGTFHAWERVDRIWNKVVDACNDAVNKFDENKKFQLEEKQNQLFKERRKSGFDLSWKVGIAAAVLSAIIIPIAFPAVALAAPTLLGLGGAAGSLLGFASGYGLTKDTKELKSSIKALKKEIQSGLKSEELAQKVYEVFEKTAEDQITIMAKIGERDQLAKAFYEDALKKFSEEPRNDGSAILFNDSTLANVKLKVTHYQNDPEKEKIQPVREALHEAWAKVGGIADRAIQAAEGLHDDSPVRATLTQLAEEVKTLQHIGRANTEHRSNDTSYGQSA